MSGVKTEKEVKKALWKLVKYTPVKDYEKHIKPNWGIVTDYIDRTCEWWFSDDYWVSECGFDFQFTDDRESVTEFGFNFCPKCGSKILNKKEEK